MAEVQLAVIATGAGEASLPSGFREADAARIYVSLLTSSPNGYQNFRMYSPRAFHGYIQLFTGEAVSQLSAIEYASQLLYSRNLDYGAAMEDRCRKYVCLAQKLDWIGQAFSLTNPTVIAALGPYPSSSDASGFGDLFFLESPTSLAWDLPQGASALIEIVWYERAATPCNLFVEALAAPEGCREVGQPVPGLGSCVPTLPDNGGGT